MAEDAVDEAIRVFELNKTASSKTLNAEAKVQPCKTRDVLLIGTPGFSSSLAHSLGSHHGLSTDIAEHLASNYGDRAWEVASESSAMARLASGYPFVESEIGYGVKYEMAQTAADILARRTRLAFLDVNAALEALPRVVDVMAEKMSWTEARKEQEWTSTVSFLASMGLSSDLAGVTREQVVRGEHRLPSRRLSVAPMGGFSGESTLKGAITIAAPRPLAHPAVSVMESRPVAPVTRE
jgi:glycerol-3-phosphate dehydrogenase